MKYEFKKYNFFINYKMKSNYNDIKKIKKKKRKKAKKKITNNNSEKETFNETQNNTSENEEINNKKKSKIFLGKKRKLIDYKIHSLQYNALNRLYNKNEISFNINNLYSIININPNLVQGRFAGLLPNDENSNDLIVEINNDINPKYNRYIIYDTKKFKIKLSFLELSCGMLYILFKGYAAFVTNDSIKIYFFSNNNTNFDIFQKIILPDDLKESILFLFKFVYDDDFYFFNKKFSLSKKNKILLYKYNKKEKENENDFAIKGRTFIEYIYLDLNFEFIWFAQKSNNELLFFYEENFEFQLYVYDISKLELIHQKRIKLNNLNHIKVANYSDTVINKRYLPLSIHNLLYIIDTSLCQISTIKLLDIIEQFKICDDNTLWTIESINNESSKKDTFYLRQYKIINETLELVKIGERLIYKADFITENIIHINNKKLLLFKKGKKLILFK